MSNEKYSNGFTQGIKYNDIRKVRQDRKSIRYKIR
jgi:hypothetical protein